MSSSNQTSRKRRLDSELSVTSGVSMLSTMTTSTDLPSTESDGSPSDTVSPMSTHPSYSSRFEFTGANNIRSPHAVNNKNNFGLAFNENNTYKSSHVGNNAKYEHGSTSRQISFNLDSNDSESELSLASSAMSPHPYDNRTVSKKPMRRARTRRATESCLPDMETAGDLPHMHRANTTSEFQRHDEPDPRVVEALIADHDARMRATRPHAMSSRSQSVNSLRSEHNIYTSLQPLNSTPQVDTVVTIPYSQNNNYLTPVTNVQAQTPDFARIDMPNAEPVRGGSPPYVGSSIASSRYVQMGNATSNTTQCCLDKNYKKGFYLLLVLNVIFILLNVVGLPFVYVTVQDHEISRMAESRQDQQLCMRCNESSKTFHDSLSLGFTLTGDGKCCLQDVDSFMEKINNRIEERSKYHSVKTDLPIYTPIIQLKSKSFRKHKSKENRAVIAWEMSPPEILHHHHGESLNNETHILIPKTGYYFIYTRVIFKLHGNTNHTVGHRVMSQQMELDAYKEKSLTENENHSSQLESVQYLTKDASIWVELLHSGAKVEQDEKHPCVFGIFLVSQ